MAEAAEKLNITGLTVFFGGSFAMGLDKVVKPYITRHSDVGGGGSNPLIVNFSQYFRSTQGIFLVSKCINSTKEVY